MILLEQLYRLLTADDQTRLLQPVMIRDSDSLAAGLVSNSIASPVGRRVIIISHIFARALPGLGQNVSDTGLRVYFRNAAIAQERDIAFAAGAGANVRVAVMTGAPLLWVEPWALQTDAGFNAAAQINTVELTVHGMQIPLGNIERL